MKETTLNNKSRKGKYWYARTAKGGRYYRSRDNALRAEAMAPAPARPKRATQVPAYLRRAPKIHSIMRRKAARVSLPDADKAGEQALNEAIVGVLSKVIAIPEMVGVMAEESNLQKIKNLFETQADIMTDSGRVYTFVRFSATPREAARELAEAVQRGEYIDTRDNYQQRLLKEMQKRNWRTRFIYGSGVVTRADATLILRSSGGRRR